MAERKKNIHVVLKDDDIVKYLSPEQLQTFNFLEEVICRGRAADGKEKFPEYYVCNTDEPYAEKVLQTILQGEDLKIK